MEEIGNTEHEEMEMNFKERRRDSDLVRERRRILSGTSRRPFDDVDERCRRAESGATVSVSEEEAEESEGTVTQNGLVGMS